MSFFLEGRSYKSEQYPFDQDFGHVLCSLLLCWKQGHGFGVEMSLTVKIC